jgi:type VII secretion protein EccE
VTRWRSHLVPAIPALLTAQFVALAVAVIVTCAGMIWWQALLVASVPAVVCLVPVRRRSVLDWVVTAARYRTGRAAATVVTDSASADGSVTGMVWDGGTVSSVIEVLPPRGGVTRLSRDEIVDDHPLPLPALAESLTQHDISLAGIDVVAHGRRVDTRSPSARVYNELVGPLPAIATRSVWLVVRFDAAEQARSVALRGGGADGATRALSVATQRITRTLSHLGTATRVLSATEIRSARDLITAGVEPLSAPRSWGHLTLPEGVNTGYSLDPRLLTCGVLTDVWAVRTEATTVTVRIRPGGAAAARLAASCRFTAAALPERPPISGVAPTTGRDASALASHQPGCASALDSLTTFTDVEVSDLESVTLSRGGCGQLVGSDADGRGVTIRVVGPDIGRVDLIGEPYLAQQVLLRAVATGARIAVHSNRPQVWRDFVGSVGDAARLSLVGADGAPAGATAVVFDGTPPFPIPAGVTAIHVGDTPTPESVTVALLQPGGHGNRIVLWAAGSRHDLTMVSTAAEATFLGRPRTAPVPVRAG